MCGSPQGQQPGAGTEPMARQLLQELQPIPNVREPGDANADPEQHTGSPHGYSRAVGGDGRWRRRGPEGVVDGASSSP